ncbi:MAG: lysophospholipid acyltransferase family protein [Planctomycetota bacterium]
MTIGTRIKIIVASRLGILAVRILGATLRIRQRETAGCRACRADGKPVIYALWHGPHFPGLYNHRNRGACVITSQSADGEILTRVLTAFGYTTVRGSSTRGGTRALIDMARMVKAGTSPALAVDGPKGPRYIVKAGVVLLAKLTQRPIIPVAGGLSAFWKINSWDRYRVPKPFSRAVVVYGDPLWIPRDAPEEAIEAKRKELEDILKRMQEDVDEESSRTGTTVSESASHRVAESTNPNSKRSDS